MHKKVQRNNTLFHKILEFMKWNTRSMENSRELDFIRRSSWPDIRFFYSISF